MRAADDASSATSNLGPDDFAIKLKVTDKECFGSAGCNITYKVTPAYKGDLSDLDGTAYDITYAVTGPEDGKQIGTISVDDTGSYDVEEKDASTRSSGTKLVAKVTSVDVY